MLREIAEKNSELEGALLKTRNEISDLEREKRTLERRLELEKEEESQSQSEVASYEKKIHRELEKLEATQLDLQKKIQTMEAELSRKNLEN